MKKTSFLYASSFRISILLVVLLQVGCSQIDRPLPPQIESPSATLSTKHPTLQTTTVQVEATDALSPSGETPDAAPTQVIQELQSSPIVRDQLIATDPSTVSIPSGKVQFVEFFAFW